VVGRTEPGRRWHSGHGRAMQLTKFDAGFPFDPTQYEDRSPSLVRTPEPLRVQRARKAQRLVARAAADAEREREWAEMYRMFAHDSVEQRRELALMSLIE
jgi:hypothetical protein